MNIMQSAYWPLNCGPAPFEDARTTNLGLVLQAVERHPTLSRDLMAAYDNIGHAAEFVLDIHSRGGCSLQHLLDRTAQDCADDDCPF